MSEDIRAERSTWFDGDLKVEDPQAAAERLRMDYPVDLAMPDDEEVDGG